MEYNNKHLNSVFLGLIFQGYSKEQAISITNNYINSSLNIQYLLLSKMKNQNIKI